MCVYIYIAYVNYRVNECTQCIKPVVHPPSQKKQTWCQGQCMTQSLNYEMARGKNKFDTPDLLAAIPQQSHKISRTGSSLKEPSKTSQNDPKNGLFNPRQQSSCAFLGAAS